MKANILEERLKEFLKHRLANSNDNAHDIGHLIRVANNAKRIMEKEGGDPLVIIASSYLHDIVSLPKNHPEKKQSSKLAAQEATKILSTEFPAFPTELYSSVEHAILTHSYSANLPPETIEAKILQDADRLDALGAIGLARVFYIAGMLGQSLFHHDDPFALNRPLDDKSYTIDHFQTKLFKLPEKMNTTEGKKLAQSNAQYLVDFLSKLSSEIKGDLIKTDGFIKNFLSSSS
ncbi:phosphohydrolase [Photorhabdus luminescens]|uniref:Phosphohydrolase n=1 Tax=Photorhabdus luminescens subsp. mexicana TaxID=2100167 RepID=A0A4R4J1S7_PHOLU|nr:phosphohydrolase [Photorhabdus luminescens]TDB47360.1 phosphohydrolase [Photorhabdus luminescens subsp. mexicana]